MPPDLPVDLTATTSVFLTGDSVLVSLGSSFFASI
nr:MAG TPA: hypothetical protein [Bacteriophage sp.]DAH37760.1 MAG TPA: hypothetical protein [Caudoviricetes sp.]